MIRYLMDLLRIPPFSMLLVALMAGLACGALGWSDISGRARAKWERAVPRPGIAGPGVYRAAPRGPRLVRMPLSVPVLGFTTCALHVGHAALVLVAVVVLRPDAALGALALALAVMGVLVSRGARALATRPSADAEDRQRVEICAVPSLVIHATIVIGLVALWAGGFDRMLVDVLFFGFKGWREWRTMSLGELRWHEAWWWWTTIEGVRSTAWVAFCLGLLVHACGAVAEAVLALRVARLHAATLEPSGDLDQGFGCLLPPGLSPDLGEGLASDGQLRRARVTTPCSTSRPSARE
jgi:hypothetical protein